MLSMLIVPVILSLSAPEPELPLAPINSLRAGAKSIGFSLPNSAGSQLLGTYMFSPHWAATLKVGVGFDRIEVLNTTTSGTSTMTLWDSALTPGARFYFLPHLRVSPWVGGALRGTYQRRPVANINKQPTDQVFHNGSLSVIGQFGAEWFVTPAVSISGEVGIEVDAIRRDYALTPAGRTYRSQLVGSFYW